MAGELICLTGATGFLGRHLVPHLLELGFRLRLLVRPSSQTDWLAGFPVELVTGDITDSRQVSKAMGGCDAAVHAASRLRFWGSPARFQRVNSGGTGHVAAAALRHRLRRLIYISSVVVVGTPPAQGVITEDTPCRPQDPYQRSKYAAERLLAGLHRSHGLPVVILRPCAFYGPYGRYGFNRLFIEDPWRGLRLQIDKGRRITFPVFVPDVAAAAGLALRRAAPGGVYNIGDQPVPQSEVQDLVSELAGLPANYLPAPRAGLLALAAFMEAVSRISRREPFYPLNLRRYVFNDWRVSSALAREELGFVPTPLREGLRRTINWYKKIL